MQKFQGKYRIDSARAKWWDYNNEGQYFITINSKDFKYVFGNVVNGEMILNDAGRIVAQCWNDLPKYYPNIILDEFCIMPNHVHFIVGIDNSVFLAPPDAFVETGLKPVCTDKKSGKNDEKRGEDDGSVKIDIAIARNENPENLIINPRLNPEMKIHGLFEFIKSFKSFSSIKINEMNEVLGVSSWHSRFHDIIIRDEKMYNTIKNYIINNPKKWKQDCYFND